MVIDEVLFYEQYRFEDCRNIRPLPFDFAIHDEHGQVLGLIEYHGIHHYIPKERFGGTKAFQKTNNNDKIKSTYCENKQIILLKISYKEFYQINDVLNEFTNELKKNDTTATSKTSSGPSSFVMSRRGPLHGAAARI